MTDDLQTKDQKDGATTPLISKGDDKEGLDTGAKKAKSSIRRTKEAKKVRTVSTGLVHIHATYNNTIVTVSDPNGSVLAWSSAGHMGFKGPKKATPFAATMIVKNLVEKIKPYNVYDVHVFVKGVGGGRESAIRTFNVNGINILSIKDITPLPHNGPRAPGPRRV